MQQTSYHYPLTTHAVEAALRAGVILRKGFGTKFAISSKESDHDLVTDYDKAAEEAILDYLGNHFPTHSFLAEESGLSIHSGSDIQWIIDPLDGTLNFAHQIPMFCVSIAAMVKNEILIGVIYDPLLDELFIAEKGFGAFLNGKRLVVSHRDSIKKAVLATGFPYSSEAMREASIGQFMKFVEYTSPLRILGSAALTMAYVAAGRFDVYWGSNLQSWDLAAAVLLIVEAGGRVTHFDGSPQNIFERSNILATNTFLHDQALSILK